MAKYYPDDIRPFEAIAEARRWLAGEVKLPYVKSCILACHMSARESQKNLTAFVAARAIGQSASTVHSARHCMGLVMYGALAVSYDKTGIQASWELIEKNIKDECLKMKEALEKISVKDEINPISNIANKNSIKT